MQIRVNDESECWREMKRLLARIGKKFPTFHDHILETVVTEGLSSTTTLIQVWSWKMPLHDHIIKCGREKSPPGQLFTCYATAFFFNY